MNKFVARDITVNVRKMPELITVDTEWLAAHKANQTITFTVSENLFNIELFPEDSFNFEVLGPELDNHSGACRTMAEDTLQCAIFGTL